MAFGYEGNYTIVGPPGCGKTTFLAKQVQAIFEKASGFTVGDQSPVLVCSLTKAAAAEAAGRDMPIPEEAVATMHAHGYRAMGRPAVAGGEVLESWNKKQPAYALTSDPAASEDDLNISAAGEAPGDYLAQQYHLYRHTLTPVDQWPDDVAHFGSCWENWKKKEAVVDYSDMIEHSPDEVPMGAGVVICDEAQDMSRLELKKLQTWGRSAGALIAVGDPYQALYTWRGADPSHLLAGIGDPKFKVLSKSYRVPQAVHAAAVGWISRLSNYKPIEYKPTEHKGHVEEFDSGFRDAGDAIHEAAELTKKGKSVMFIASCNFMADTIARQLKEAGVPFSNPWRTTNYLWNPMAIRKGVTMRERIISLLRPARPIHGDARRMWTVGEFWQWASVLKAEGLFVRGGKKRAEEAADTDPGQKLTSKMIAEWCVGTDLIQSGLFHQIWKWFEDTDAGKPRPVSELLTIWRGHMAAKKASGSIEYMGGILAGVGYKGLVEDPKISIGTIHSFKGGEADAVFLFPDITMRTYEGWIDGSGDAYDSVVRGYYVGMTRARETLYLCHPSSKLFVDW